MYMVYNKGHFENALGAFFAKWLKIGVFFSLFCAWSRKFVHKNWNRHRKRNWRQKCKKNLFAIPSFFLSVSCFFPHFNFVSRRKAQKVDLRQSTATKLLKYSKMQYPCSIPYWSNLGPFRDRSLRATPWKSLKPLPCVLCSEVGCIYEVFCDEKMSQNSTTNNHTNDLKSYSNQTSTGHTAQHLPKTWVRWLHYSQTGIDKLLKIIKINQRFAISTLRRERRVSFPIFCFVWVSRENQRATRRTYHWRVMAKNNHNNNSCILRKDIIKIINRLYMLFSWFFFFENGAQERHYTYAIH